MATAAIALPNGPPVKRRRVSGKQADPTAVALAARSEHATGPRMVVSKSHTAAQLGLIVINSFDDNQLGLAPLAHAAGPLKDLLAEALSNSEMFKLKTSITWVVSSTSDIDVMWRDYSMNLNVINVHQSSAPLGGGGVPRITALLQRVRQAALDKIEFAKTQSSGLIFHKIKEIRFAMVPHPRELALAHRRARAPFPELDDGGCTVKMPKALANKRCCLNIQNKDEFCFRYCLIAWIKGTAGTKNAERPAQYLRNAPSGRGRRPKDFVPEFDDGDLDFSMLAFPVKLDEITPFEEANNIGVYVFGWCQKGDEGFARPVRAPDKVYEREVQLLLHMGHYLLVTRFTGLFRLDRNRGWQHTCHRCIADFNTEASLQRHLAKGSCLPNGPAPPQELTLPKPEKKQKKVFERFKKFELMHDVPIVVYADFETFQSSADEQRGAKTNVLGRMSGVASFGYYVASRVPSIPSVTVLERSSADKFVLHMLELALRYRHACRNPVALKMRPEDEDDFANAAHCYMCGTQASELCKDHDHFTGAYRGAACPSCNIKAQCPKQIAVLFHNLEGFDGHEIIHAIARLRNAPPPSIIEDGNPAEENEDDGEDSDEESECEHKDGGNSLLVDTSRLAKLRFSILANSTEKYMQIAFGPLVFRDTFKFADAGLEKLIKSQRLVQPSLGDCFPILCSQHPFLRERRDGEALDLILRKVPMAYGSIRDESYFGLPAVLEKRCYDNDLTGEACSDGEYELVRHVVDFFQLRDQGEYHDLYLYTDVLALADCMETMRAGWRRHCGLDLFGSVTLPSASYQAMLKQTRVNMELISDDNGGMEMMKLLNENIRGGASCIFQPFARANNPRVLPASPPASVVADDAGELRDAHERIRAGHAAEWDQLPAEYVAWCKREGYDHEKALSWIVYVDANSLYPTTMCWPLPVGDYKRELLPEDQPARISQVRALMDLYTDSSSKGYVVEVSFHVPKHLHDALDYAPVAKRAVDPGELSEHQRSIAASLGAGSQTAKLVPDLGVHRKVLFHIDLLKFWVGMGVEIFEVHSLWSWRQSRWMMEYIVGMARQRAKTKDPVLREILKKAMNSLYGKMLQDKSSQRNLVPYTSALAFVKACSRPNFVDCHIMQIDTEPGVPFFGLVESTKKGGVVLDSPRAAGFAILELSKLLMLRGHYHFFKQSYGERARLLFTDTDSLCYCIEAPNPLEDMLRSRHVAFDLASAFLESDLEGIASSPGELEALKAQLLAQKGQLGALKLENETSFILEFAGLASKMYSLLMVDRSGLQHGHMKGKGVPKRVLASKATHEKYKEMLFEPHASSATFVALRSHNHVVEKLEITKKMLTPFNDKVFQISALSSRPLGHWRNAVATEPRSEASVGGPAASSGLAR